MLRLLQERRGLRHMQLSHNSAVAARARQVRAAIENRIAALDARSATAARFGGQGRWEKIRQGWDRLKTPSPSITAKESYAAYSMLIGRLLALDALVADQSGLTLDPELASYRLGGLVVQRLPAIADELSLIAGRGAAYIDTGLLEANEDLLLHSTILVASRDLGRIAPQFESVFQENPGLRPQLQDRLAAVKQSLAFLDRARDEVVNAYNQTSGERFFGAGAKSIDALYAAADAAAASLDQLLQQRSARAAERRNLVAAALLAALAVAAWLLAGFYVSFSRGVAQLEEAVERASGGDLAHRVASGARDEIGSLRTQAITLSQAVQVFKLDAQASTPAMQPLRGFMMPPLRTPVVCRIETAATEADQYA